MSTQTTKESQIDKLIRTSYESGVVELNLPEFFEQLRQSIRTPPVK